MVKRLLALAGLVLLAAGCGASQQHRISEAIRESPFTESARSQRLTIQVSQIRVAQSDPDWATALVSAHDSRGREAISPERAILQRDGTWSVVRLGGEVPYPSCEQTPQAVIEELFAGWCFIARGELRRIGRRSLG